MRTKCHSCLCRSCLVACCGSENKINCQGKKESCENYNGFKQESVFEQPQPQYQAAPRHSWHYYGISRARYKQLAEYIHSGRYATVARQAAHTANKDIAEYLVMSIEKELSYDDLERMWTLKEIERMPVGRSDFYGWRRYYMHIFDMELRRIGK